MTCPLDDALSSWQRWRAALPVRPVLVNELRGGYTNNSYLIASDSLRFVLRMHQQKTSQVGINRQQERFILGSLATIGIAPRMVYLAEDERYSVLEYIEGRVWTKADILKPSNAHALLQCIKSYQCVEIDIRPVDYEKLLLEYWYLFTKKKRKRAREHKKRFSAFLSRFKTFQPEYGLTHHDLRPSNIIETPEGIRIIDWEFAALGDQRIDTLILARFRFKQTRKSVANDDKIRLELIDWLDFLWWQIA